MIFHMEDLSDQVRREDQCALMQAAVQHQELLPAHEKGNVGRLLKLFMWRLYIELCCEAEMYKWPDPDPNKVGEEFYRWIDQETRNAMCRYAERGKVVDGPKCTETRRLVLEAAGTRAAALLLIAWEGQPQPNLADPAMDMRTLRSPLEGYLPEEWRRQAA